MAREQLTGAEVGAKESVSATACGGLAILAAICACPGGAAARPGLIVLASPGMYARDLSGDGKVVVGTISGVGAFRWTQAGGVQPLSTSPIGSASGVSFDGSVIVGSDSPGVFRWTASGTQTLGIPPGFESVGWQTRVSADGSVILGWASNATTLTTAVWRWTQAGGFQVLPGPVAYNHSVSDLSADGNVATGNDLFHVFRTVLSWQYPGEAFRHTMSGSAPLPSPGGSFHFAAYGISGDGQTIVGERWLYNPLGHPDAHAAVRWVGAGGPQEIPLLAGHPESLARAVSFDGSVIAGTVDQGWLQGWLQTPTAVWIWTEAEGTRDLKQVLIGLGVGGAGAWTFQYVRGMSDDGATILGQGDLGYFLASLAETCYADCNADSMLTVADFGCFQTRFVAGDPYADCNGVGGLTIADFGCFQTRFVAGCP